MRFHRQPSNACIHARIRRTQDSTAMPLPSLVPSFRPRSHISRAKEASSQSEEVPSHRTSDDTRIESSEHDSVASRVSIPRTSSDQPSAQQDSDGSRRRSFLPQRGLPKSLLRPVGLADSPASKTAHARTKSIPIEGPSGRPPSTTSQRSDTSSTPQGRPRPRSLYQPRPTNVDAEGKEGISMRPPVSTKPLRPAAVPRSASLRQPGIPSKPPQNITGSHARTQSTSIVRGIRGDLGNTKSRMERSKSVIVAPSQNTKVASGPTPDTAIGTTRTSARLEGLKRATSTRAKAEATRTRATSTTSANNSEPEPPARRPEATKEEPRKPGRPAFNILQQHFTPRKTGKAPTSTFLHPAPDTSTQHPPPETIALQSELLQLYLLHRTSAQTRKQWERSAQENLRIKYDEVVSLFQVMREHERYGLEQKNIFALREWNGAHSPSGLVEHIRALSGPLNEFPSLLDSGGRYHRLVHDFDRWTSQVEEVWLIRNSQQDRLGNMGSLEGLGDSWKEENAVLTRKLTALLRDLDRLSLPAQGSSIASIVTTCKHLLEGLAAELHIMLTIEHDMVTKEKHWVEDRLRVIAQHIGARVKTTEGGEVWRM
jgi:hypothetical protein